VWTGTVASTEFRKGVGWLPAGDWRGSVPGLFTVHGPAVILRAARVVARLGRAFSLGARSGDQADCQCTLRE
jgi:hypothetical protein